jgi:diaminopimelate epimerase
MILLFAKYHGAGNDFIVIDDRTEAFPVSHSAFVQSLCQRHTGIGADGLILLQSSSRADARMRIFNSDGHEAALCGNGLRCLVDFAHRLHLIGSRSTIETKNRLVACEWTQETVTVDLGPYEFLAMKLSFEALKFHLINTGVPHAVAFVEDDHFALAPQIRSHPSFGSEGANVNFAMLKGSKLHIRTYERGVEGETLACGSGAAAVAVAAHHVYHLSNPITIVPCSGEELQVNVLPASLRLTGKATFVFHGSVECAN